MQQKLMRNIIILLLMEGGEIVQKAALVPVSTSKFICKIVVLILYIIFNCRVLINISLTVFVANVLIK